MKKIIILVFICLISINGLTQSEAANWYFGYGGGIKFNQTSNTISSLNDGQLFTNEGCASISDDSGNLLFYTNGTTVWDKNHNIMDNGDGLFGDASSTQSALIIPKPDDKNIYYIFTVDSNVDGINYGLNYSVVNLSLNGGLGSITNKNINLLELSSEKITAVLKDCISKSIWVLALASENGDKDFFNTYHAFEVSNLGVNTNSVKSTFNNEFLDARGYLKFSPDGTRVASANIVDGLYLYEFETFNGRVSSPLKLNLPADNFSYGIEFSPNSELLYVHASNNFFNLQNQASNNTPSNHKSSLFQFNLLATNIESSLITLDSRQLYRGALQLGPNGKIYRALSSTYNMGIPYLGVINNPNEVGINANYIHNAINLSPNNSSQGLPPFIASFFNKEIDIINNGQNSINLSLCENDIYTLSAEKISGATYTWTFNDMLLPETDNDLMITQNGHYELYIEPNNGDCALEGEAYVVFNENPKAYNASLLQCDEDGSKDGLTLFNLNQAHSNLTNNNNELSTKFYTDNAKTQEINGNSFYNTSNPQIIYVEVIDNTTGCTSSSELTLSVSITDSKDVELIECDNDGIEDGLFYFDLTMADSAILNGIPSSNLTIAYYETYDDALLEINKLGTTFANKTPYAQTIYARVENANNCYGISNITLTLNKLPDIETEALTFYCINTFPEKITLNAGIINDNPNNYTYNWSTGESTYNIDVNQTGEYTVTVTNKNNCSKKKRIIVEASNIATFENINIIDATQHNSISILVSGEGIYEYQLLDSNALIYRPYQEDHMFKNVLPGIYTVSVKDTKNHCGIVQTLISVIGFPKFFTPNNDGIHDTWQVIGLSEMFQPNTNIQIFNRYGKLLKQLNPLSIGWDGTFNGEKLPADDYWFKIKLQDGRVFRSHFTLIY